MLTSSGTQANLPHLGTGSEFKYPVLKEVVPGFSENSGSPSPVISISLDSRVSPATSMANSAFPFVLATQMVICHRVRTEESFATHKGEQMNELAWGNKDLNLGSQFTEPLSASG